MGTTLRQPLPHELVCTEVVGDLWGRRLECGVQAGALLTVVPTDSSPENAAQCFLQNCSDHVSLEPPSLQHRPFVQVSISDSRPDP